MKICRVEEFTRGWIYGNFEPAVYNSKDTEVGVLSFAAGDEPPDHYHRIATEINMVIRGLVKINGQLFYKGDIFIFEPMEVSHAVFIQDTEILVIKTPSVQGDKYVTG